MKNIELEFTLPEFTGTPREKMWTMGITSFFWIVFSLYVGTQYAFSFLEIILFSYLGISLLWRWSGRIAAGVALVFLIGAPTALLFEKNEWAELCAVYAFYSLVIAVIDEVILLWTTPGTSDGKMAEEKKKAESPNLIQSNEEKKIESVKIPLSEKSDKTGAHDENSVRIPFHAREAFLSLRNPSECIPKKTNRFQRSAFETRRLPVSNRRSLDVGRKVK